MFGVDSDAGLVREAVREAVLGVPGEAGGEEAEARPGTGLLGLFSDIVT